MRILVFGGTSEGRELSSALSDVGIIVTLSVATEFGRETAAGCGAEIVAERLDACGIAALIEESGFDHVIDATHPYAVQATENIRSACRKTGADYYRLRRPESGIASGVTYVPDIPSAVEELKKSDAKALLTTGSKELRHFTQIDNYRERLFVRILPMAESLKTALDLGFRGSNIICMQGPFDAAMNAATLSMTGADIIVTKDSGDNAGFEEKVSAARALGRRVIAVSRPMHEEGYTLDELLGIFNAKPEVKEREAFFPLFIPMSGRKVLLVGGGNVAGRRARTLAAFGADITVISPKAGEYIKGEAARGAIRFLEKEYEEGDVAKLKPFLVIAATDCRQANNRVMTEARGLGISVSVSDNRGECTCFFPAIAESESYIAGIVSKDGNHSGLKDMAEKIRRELFT